MMGEVSNVTSKYAEFIYLDENGSEAPENAATDHDDELDSRRDSR